MVLFAWYWQSVCADAALHKTDGRRRKALQSMGRSRALQRYMLPVGIIHFNILT